MVTIYKEIFGDMNGREINKYKMVDDNGFQVNVINYGAIITDIITKDRNNKFVNIVLGYNKFEDYKKNESYIGAIIGRTAGRTEKGKFSIDGKEFSLHINNGNNSSHGGSEGLDKKIFDVEIIDNGIILNYISPDMEEGYPGNLNVSIKYTIEENSTLKMEYQAISDKDTYVNLTNHSYFNLSGYKIENGAKQTLKINAEKFLELDSNMIPRNVKDVKSSIFDFRSYRLIEEGLLEGHEQFLITRGYDHPFILDKSSKEFSVDASLYSQTSGIKMDVITNQESLVFYSGNFLEFSNERYIGIALETQAIPNRINSSDVSEKEMQVLKKGDKYYSETFLKFSVHNKI
jgi:aldose 1-epimerase